MSIFVAAIIVVGALCLFDLLLTFGVIRRLRAQSDQLTSLLGDQTIADLTVPVGHTADDFAGTTITGASVTREWLRNTTLVGFFSADCSSCQSQLPLFVRYAVDFAGPVLAVTAGRPDRTASMVADLSVAATVVDEGIDGPIASAFGVRGFPAILLVDGDGRVVHSGASTAGLPTFA
jgi:thiol-disulfide isomerase/thioredoxin